METKFTIKCPICGKIIKNTDVVRTIFGGIMCMRCYLHYYLKSQDNESR